MERDWHVLEAMQFCRYKAWLLSKEDRGGMKTGTEEEGIIFLNKPSLSIRDKVVTTAYFLSRNYGGKSISILNGGTTPTKVSVALYRLKADRLLTDTADTVGREEPPPFYRNPHCPDCVFRNSCMQKLKERDCISLLGGVKQKVLDRYHKRGIFSITQLSHTFRPRRRGRRPHIAGTSFLWDLKALAIREQKIYVMHPPELEPSPVSIYMDFEGLPEENREYLIGVIVRQEGREDETWSFWADTIEDEKAIFVKLFDLLERFPKAPVYHYGSYEAKALRRIGKKWGGVFGKRAKSTAERLVNLLGYLRTHVYPPTYGNGLKELGNFLGVTWTDPEADGPKSIVWRKEWESDRDAGLKECLVSYNMDDCRALVTVRQWFDGLVQGADADRVFRVAEMKKISPFRFHDNPEFSEDFQHINKAAYFDYQRTKIYLRGEKKTAIVPAAVTGQKGPGKGHPAWNPKKINEVVHFPHQEKCTKCGCTKLYRISKHTSKIQTDLKFTDTGIRQWVVEFHTGYCQCAKCGTRLNDGLVRMLQYGDNLFAWAINLYVNHNVSYHHLAKMLQEQFGIWINPLYMMQRKCKWIKKWEPELDYIRATISKSPVVHIDETPVRLSKDKGYVWVFATAHTVLYHFTLTRETGFIETFLKKYKGVIVTDSFPGYDSLPVRRQKCLIHFMRDMNDDLFKNPFDMEYGEMVREFGQLLRKVVETVDKKGLQTKFLQKHLNDVGGYFRKHVDVPHKSELAVKYAKRMARHWEEMWTFLECDGVPWNNNNAEYAIKAFAMFRHRVNGQVSESGLKEYLQLLTMAQTCRYRGISFLDFLRRKVGLWENVHPEVLPGFLPFSQARMYARRFGFQRRKEWVEWTKGGKRPVFIPASPQKVYENKGWVNLSDFLGFSYMPFKQARTYMRKLGLKNRDEYWEWLKSGRRPLTIPAVPEKIYRDTGWVDLGDWLGTGNKGQQKKLWMPYEDAKRYVQASGIKSQAEYFEWRKSGQRPETIPSSPSAVYGHKFEGWGKFLGTDRVANQNKKYWGYEEAKAFLRPLALISYEHFKKLSRLGILPVQIPKAAYAYYRKNGEWVSFSDFLGRENH